MKFVLLAIFATFVTQPFHLGGKIPVTFAIFTKFADSTKPFLAFCLYKSRILKNLLFLLFCHICYSIVSHSEKNFCDICYFFYTFLIAVLFRSFRLKLRKTFASKFLLTRSILDISAECTRQFEEIFFWTNHAPYLSWFCQLANHDQRSSSSIKRPSQVCGYSVLRNLKVVVVSFHLFIRKNVINSYKIVNI